jgi:hypothetical protein
MDARALIVHSSGMEERPCSPSSQLLMLTPLAPLTPSGGRGGESCRAPPNSPDLMRCWSPSEAGATAPASARSCTRFDFSSSTPKAAVASARNSTAAEGVSWQHPRFWIGLVPGPLGLELPAGGGGGGGGHDNASESAAQVDAVAGAEAEGEGTSVDEPSAVDHVDFSEEAGQALLARNKALEAQLATERESSERDRSSARNLIAALHERIASFEAMTTVPDAVSSTSPTAPSAATSADRGSTMPTGTADDASRAATAAATAAAAAAASRIAFLESQVEAGDELLIQTQSVLKAHITELESAASAAAVETASLRSALNRHTHMHEELMDLASRKEEKLKQRIELLESELADTKTKLTRSEQQQQQQQTCSSPGGEGNSNASSD